MTLSTRPSVAPGDDLDGLLRAFYEAQMPHPWPGFRAPAPPRPTTPVRPVRGWLPLLRSRLALAASVALLLLGSLFLPGKAPPEAGGPKRVGRETSATLDNPRRPSRPAVEARPRLKMRESLEQKKDAPTAINIMVWPEAAPGR